MLGGSPLDTVAHNLLDPTLVSSPAPAPTSPAQAEGGSTMHMFRGCLGPSRLAGVLLPFFSPQDLNNNSAENQFFRMVRTLVVVCGGGLGTGGDKQIVVQ